MIEIRLVKDYDKSQLKFILDKVKEVAPRELTYSLREVVDVDVKIKEKSSVIPANDYVSISTRFSDDLWVVIQDRKSTRLNSSHVSISYAVFCLKKKTTA